MIQQALLRDGVRGLDGAAHADGAAADDPAHTRDGVLACASALVATVGDRVSLARRLEAMAAPGGGLFAGDAPGAPPLMGALCAAFPSVPSTRATLQRAPLQIWSARQLLLSPSKDNRITILWKRRGSPVVAVIAAESF